MFPLAKILLPIDFSERCLLVERATRFLWSNTFIQS